MRYKASNCIFLSYDISMEDLKIIVGKNLSALRKQRKITQIELAEKFNYSDKAVSKWEQGSTLPDLETLKQLCDFYGVTLDYLTQPENITNPHYDKSREKTILINHIIITCLIAVVVWMVATITFVYPLLFQGKKESYWPIFVWAVPVSSIVLLFSNFIFFNKRKIITLISLSIFIWTLLTSLFLHFLFFVDQGTNLWLIFILGIPTQIIVVLWFIIRKK